MDDNYQDGVPSDSPRLGKRRIGRRLESSCRELFVYGRPFDGIQRGVVDPQIARSGFGHR